MIKSRMLLAQFFVISILLPYCLQVHSICDHRYRFRDLKYFRLFNTKPRYVNSPNRLLDEVITILKTPFTENVATILTEHQSNLVGFAEVKHGTNNHCYKCYSKVNPSNSLFIKHVTGALRNMPNIQLNTTRLNCEFQGMIIFEKYSPNLIPKPLYFNETNNVLICEYLYDYIPLRTALIQGDISIDCARAIGTIMGRSHARTSEYILSAKERHALEQTFDNEDHFYFWQATFFEPTKVLFQQNQSKTLLSSLSNLQTDPEFTFTTINNPQRSHDVAIEEAEIFNVDNFIPHLSKRPASESEKVAMENNRFEELLTQIDPDGSVLHSIEVIEDIYKHKKVCLIHGDLNCNNVMTIDPNDQENKYATPFKVIDFERIAFGPPGFDLGLCLASYLWYFVAHSNPTTRRSIIGAVLAVVEAYKAAFRVQISNAMKKRRIASLPMNIEMILNEICVDAVGFMGLYTLFLVLYRDDIEAMPVDGVKGADWGDYIGRRASIRRRQLRVSVDALKIFKLFHTTDLASKNSLLDNRNLEMNILNELSTLFSSDDESLQKDHVSEFWY